MSDKVSEDTKEMLKRVMGEPTFEKAKEALIRKHKAAVADLFKELKEHATENARAALAKETGK